MASKKAKNTEIENQEPSEEKELSVVDPLSLLKAFAKSINKEFGENSVTLFTTNEGSIDCVKDFIKTGVTLIDYILGGKGFPVGRISEIYGESSSGKTAIAMHVLKAAIERGGTAIMLDSEAAFSFSMANKIGLDRTKLAYTIPKTLEDMWRYVENIIHMMRDKAPTQLCCIVVDSIASSPSQKELSGDIGDYEMGERARINSKALRKITAEIASLNICLVLINQVRDSLAMFGDKEMIPGGRAIDFHSTIKIKVRKGKVIVDEQTKEPIGQNIGVKCTKNKVAEPFKKVELEFYFDSGISKYSGLMDKMIKAGIVKKSGSYYYLEGENVNFYSKDFPDFMERHPELNDFTTWSQHMSEKEDV